MENKENKALAFVCKQCGNWENLLSIEETSGQSKIYPYGKEGEWDIGYDDYEPYHSEVVGYFCHDCSTRYTEEEIKQLKVKEVPL
jgi:hypothetical protein